MSVKRGSHHAGGGTNRAGTGIVLRGVLELEQTLNSIRKDIAERAVARAAEAGANVIMVEAKRLCPVRTGKLRASIHVKRRHVSSALKKYHSKDKKFKDIERTSYAVIAGEGFFQGDTFYSGMVEFGTKHMAAQPFMRPAAHAKRQLVAMLFRNEINKVVKGNAKRRAHTAVKNIGSAVD